ncbi:helicase HerA domain-containing protein [Streptomyces erythrochromogenes]|uniref:helicase HerA domain-containing protein n=1 Tax=Streptomyces erythrochromogenes TaxID=285574 RepID=UPI0038646BBD|nr:ATP-binding protein [Streptomyces erythrochromogenes]
MTPADGAPAGPAELPAHRFHRLLTVPRRPEDPNADDRTAAQLTAAVTAAHAVLGHHAAGGPTGLAAAWIRPGPHRPMHFLVGGAPYFPPAGDTASPAAARGDAPRGAAARPLSYPPGATAQDVPPGEIAALLQEMPYWLPCLGSHDALRMGDDERVLPTERRGSFDDAVAHLPDAFAWLVLAEPVPYERLEQERAALAVQLPRLRQRENSAADRVAAERAEARYRELTRALATGVWNVRVLVGGHRPESALASAALLCGSGDLDDLPYVLVPARRPVPLAEALTAAGPQGPGSPGASPFLAPAELVAALARPPARELPGIRTVAPNRFDVTADDTGESSDGFLIGDILDETLSAAGRLRVSRATLNRHAFVCGATGSGKSQTVRSLLTALSTHERPVPWLAIEPAKAEYARMAGRLAAADGPEAARRVTVIRPGDVDVPPASLNPLEPEPGFPLQSHVDLVRALFLAAFEGHEPFPQVLARALSQCYTEAGWDLVTGEPRPAHKPKFVRDEPDEPRSAAYPTLGALQATARRVVEMIGYGKEVTADVRGFVDVRMGSLREGTPGRFFEGGHPLDIAGLLSGNVVLELETITNDQDKAFLIGAVLIRLVEHLRVHHGRGGVPLRHVLVVEEAHRLLKNTEDGPAAAAVELFASLLAEIRAYGEGVVIVEQIPSKILPDVVKNSALKIMHRLPAEDDRRAVGATMNLQQDQSENVVALPPGRAAVAADGMDRPVLTEIPHGEHDESTKQASAEPPLLGSRSPLCGAACHREPCTLRTMNDSHHRSLEPLHLIWVEAAASAQAMGMAAPAPAAAVREALRALAPRDLECTLVYAVERAVSAREALMRDEVDPADFAERLYAVLSDLLLGVEPRPADRRRYTYANYRFRDVLEAVHHARRARPDGPHAYPDEAPDWAARGLVLTGTTPTDHFTQITSLAGYGSEKAHGRIGDVVRSGLRAAVLTATGGLTEAHVRRAFRPACTGPRLLPVLDQIAERIARQCVEERGA